MPPYTRYGMRRIEQRMLEHARLRVAAIEQRDLVERQAVADEPLDDVDDERRLVEVGRRRERAHRLALAFARPQVLAEPRRVVLDQRVGRVEDVAVRAVVLLELDQLAPAHPAVAKSRSKCCMFATFAPRNA